MKYTYTGRIPTVILIDGKLSTINSGDVVSLNKAPSPQFILESAKVAFSMPKVTKAKKTKPTAKNKIDASGS